MSQWNREGLPYKGWTCVNVVDLGEDVWEDDEIKYEQCEWCGNEKIRYIHVMKHPDFRGELNVGCVCAEKMTDDYVNPRRVEGELRKKASRRTTFLRQKWNYNPTKQTYTIKYKGEYITIMKSRYDNSWGVYYNNHKIWDVNGRKICSFDDAVKVAFNVFDEFHMTQDEREYQFRRHQMGLE